MRTAIPQAVENRPWLALAVIVAVCFYPAAQLTIEEWKDAIDASRTTQWQPELVLDAWANAARTFPSPSTPTSPAPAPNNLRHESGISRRDPPPGCRIG